MRNYPTEWRGHSIYSEGKRWPVNLGRTRGGRRWIRPRARWIRVHSRGNYSGEPRRARVSRSGAVESASHAAHDREAAVSGELIRFGCRARGGSTTGVLGVESSSPTVRIFTGRNLSDGHGDRQSTATGHRRRARDGIFFSLTLTVPWRLISVNLTEQIGVGFTLNFQ
jgi:hypothetical protein